MKDFIVLGRRGSRRGTGLPMAGGRATPVAQPAVDAGADGVILQDGENHVPGLFLPVVFQPSWVPSIKEENPPPAMIVAIMKVILYPKVVT